MSGGEQQRLAIIRALAHDPDLLILDEPVSSLDVAGRRDFLRELIDSVIERQTTVVFSTHILSDLERVASDVAFMKEGEIILRESLDAVLEHSRRLIGTAAAFGSAPIQGEISRRTDNQGRVSVIAFFQTGDTTTTTTTATRDALRAKARAFLRHLCFPRSRSVAVCSGSLRTRPAFAASRSGRAQGWRFAYFPG